MQAVGTGSPASARASTTASGVLQGSRGSPTAAWYLSVGHSSMKIFYYDTRSYTALDQAELRCCCQHSMVSHGLYRNMQPCCLPAACKGPLCTNHDTAGVQYCSSNCYQLAIVLSAYQLQSLEQSTAHHRPVPLHCQWQRQHPRPQHRLQQGAPASSLHLPVPAREQ